MQFKIRITIEPAIFLLAFSHAFSDNGQVNLILGKVCETDLCKNGLCERPDKCLQQSTGINSWKAIIKTCLPVIPILIAGNWRDKHGRNIPLLLLPTTGQIFGSTVCLLSSIFWQEFPIIPTVLLEAIITGFTGGISLLIMSATCFISARTSMQDRTHRLSLVVAAYLSGYTIGLLLSGTILQKFGFIILYSVAASLAVASLLHTLCFVNEVAAPSKKRMSVWLFYEAVVRKREHNRRPVIIMLIIIHFIFGTSILCEGNIFLFFIEESLKFSVEDAGVFFALKITANSLSNILIIPVLSKYYKMNDILLGILSAIINCVSSLISAFSRSRLELSLCPLGDLFRGGIIAVEKSIVTKYVGPNEIGQVLSVELLLEACCYFLMLPVYTFVFNHTAEVFPGAFFFLTGLSSLICLIIFCIIKYLTKRNETPKLDNNPDEFATHL